MSSALIWIIIGVVLIISELLATSVIESYIQKGGARYKCGCFSEHTFVKIFG